MDRVDHDREVAHRLAVRELPRLLVPRRHRLLRAVVVDDLVGAQRRRRLPVLALVGVADHAIPGVDPRAATVERQMAVAVVARGDRHDVALRGGRVVDEVDRLFQVHRRDRRVRAVRRVVAGVARRAGNLHGHALRLAGVVARVAEIALHRVGAGVDEGLHLRDVHGERVLVLPVAQVLQLAVAVGARRPQAGHLTRAGIDPHHDVVHPVARTAVGARHQLGDRGAHAALRRQRRARGQRVHLVEADDGVAVEVGHPERDRRRPAAERGVEDLALHLQRRPRVRRQGVDLDPRRRHRRRGPRRPRRSVDPITPSTAASHQDGCQECYQATSDYRALHL